MSGAFFRALARRAARRYPAADRWARAFCYFKLTGDPVFRHLLESGAIPRGARLLDLGAGQGMLEVLIAAASESHAKGDWPARWPPAPAPARIRAIDLVACDVERGKAACAPNTEFVCGDIREASFGEADTVVILDVLHYLDYASQDGVLERVRATLRPGGLLLLRVADASPGLRFRITEWIDRASIVIRGRRPGRYHCRPLAAWQRRLADLGFDVRARPMSAGTPFANVLLVATAR